MSERRHRLALLAALLLLGAGLRLYHLGYRSLSTDEANVFWMARGGVAEILHANAAGNSAPPLYALALNPFAEAHAPEVGLRAISCAAGIVALLALFGLTREYAGSGGALFAVFVAALSPSQVFYSQFLREYSLAFLFALLLLWAFTRFQRRPSWASWAALTAAIVVSLFLQYGLALLILALNLVFLLALRGADQRGRRLALWSLAQLAGLAAAWIVYDGTLRHQLRPGGFGASYLAQGYWDGSLASLLRLTVGNSFELIAFTHPSVPVLQALVVLGIVELWRAPRGRQAILLLVLPLAVTLGAALLRFYPYLGARQSIALTAMFYVVAGCGFTLLRRHDWQWLGSALVIAWLAAEGFYGSYRTLHSVEPQHLRPIAALLAERVQPGERIYVFHQAVTPFRYYFPPNTAAWIHGLDGSRDPEVHRRHLREILADPGPLWLVFSHCAYNECETVRRAAAEHRTVHPIAREIGAELYLASDGD